MRLKPFVNNDPSSLINPDTTILEPIEPEVLAPSIPYNLQEVLVESGVAFNETKQGNISEIRKIFKDHGAGVDDVARQVANIMSRSDQDSARLRACEIAMEVQGIISKMGEKESPNITINIIGSQHQTLVNLVCPD